MASVYHLYKDALNVKQKIVHKYSDHSENDKKLYFAATTIQRTWRGYATRKIIKHWNEAATTIQKLVRGWLVRWHMPEVYKEYYYNLSVKYYNNAATKIQSLWRGWRERKSGYDIKALLAERSRVACISEDMRMKLQELFDELEAKNLDETQKCIEKILMILFDRHHLLRTTVIEGIFSIHESSEFSLIEKILKSLSFKDYMLKLREILYRKEPVYKHETESNPKRFDLNTHIKSKPYESMLL